MEGMEIENIYFGRKEGGWVVWGCGYDSVYIEGNDEDVFAS